MAKSTLINLILIDGTANGRIKCKINGRTGIIFKIPRKDLSKCKEHDELKHDGVYFLLGEDKIYIGQAGSRKNGKGILNRLNEHDRNPDKNFWTETIIFTTSDNSFGSTEISWLENKFCNMAIKAARYVVTNGNIPPLGNITEEKKSELEAHAEFVELILSAIGYKIFEPEETSPPKFDEEIFYITRPKREIEATMIRTATGYKVLAGSKISKTETTSLPAPERELRNSDKVKDYILQEDIDFSKSSPAANFVLGASANGTTEWKTKNGEPLKNFLEGK